MIRRMIVLLLHSERGANLAEYAIVAMAVAVAAVMVIGFVGDATAANYEAVMPGFGG